MPRAQTTPETKEITDKRSHFLFLMMTGTIAVKMMALVSITKRTLFSRVFIK
jgi:hypothetical protein